MTSEQHDDEPIAQSAAEASQDPPPRRKRRRRGCLWSLLVFLVLIAVAIGGIWWHLNSNIRTAALTRGGATNGDLSKAQPLNLLVLGSDTRSSAEDCKIGGGCTASEANASKGSDSTGNADVEMLIHLSADRKHAQIVSIPRDTVVDLPACTDPQTGKEVPAHQGRINSSMNYGPDCTVAAVHQLTGLPIAHFAVIDFHGVVTMSNAIGGVNVCVDKDVYDPYSHLKLKKGKHSLKGEPALQFLRTRHAFGDGSDLGRADAQHLFLSAMINKMTSASTLVNPATAYQLADAATKALTVDKGLGSVDRLVEAAYQFGKVPDSGTQMLTMPTIYNPQNRNEVLPAPSAASVWARLAADQPIDTKPKATATASSSSATNSTQASPSASNNPEPKTVSPSADPGCAQVSAQPIVNYRGTMMTPTQAYAAATDVPDSAP